MGMPVWEAAADPDGIPTLGAAARKALHRFMSTMHRLKERTDEGTPVGELIQETLTESGYLEALEAERTIEAQGRIENLEELVRVGREYDTLNPEGTLEEFLQQISLLADADNLKDDEGLVTLMTLHNAKGLEFPIVFIIGMEDGVFPHSRALDEGARGGGAPARLRRHHPRDARPDAHLRAPPERVRGRVLRRPLAVHRRDPGRADRPGRARGGRLPDGPGRFVGRRGRGLRARRRRRTRRGRSSASATTSSTPSSARAW